ncbi:MAG: xanthine dehydrogenase family protein molybdopterin-binding subunit [Deltaproteobacteria bacterium]|nr:xanthine dehydrogenase family protein molybdopterin-binding subunit [Deltaproteobacteria bacterium]
MADLAGINGQRENFRVVGKPNLPGRLSYAIATGVAKYGADYIVPDMLHAKFLRSPYANARIVSIDTARAKKIPGVVDILTWEDEDIKNLLETGEMMMGPLKPIIINTADQEGTEIGAIVVAETEDICDEALRQLEIKWEVLPNVVDILEGRRPDYPVIRPSAPKSESPFGGSGMGGGDNPPKKGNVSYSNVSAGDIEAGFREADHIIEYDVNIPSFSGHIPNPQGSMARWFKNTYHGEGMNLHIEGVMSPNDPGTIGNMYKMPHEKIFQECMLMGGRYCDWGLRKSQLITPLLAKRTGRPVRCVDSRYDQYDFNLNQRFMHMKVGFKKNGLITAIHDHSIADSGVEGSSIFGTTMDQNYGPYFTTRCQNVKQNMDIVDSNRGKMYLSGQHNPMNWDSITIAMHLIADKLGKDPIEIVRLNLHGPKSQTDPDPVPSFEACVETAKKMMNWKWHNTGGKKLKDGRMHGASFRYQQCPRHSGMVFNCKLELRNGVVYLDSKGPVIGNYIMEANMMVVAEELGLNYEDIRGRLDHHEVYKPWGGGSDGTTASGWALKECANILKKQILEKAIEEANNPPMSGGFGPPAKTAPSPFKGMKPEDLDLKDGKVIVKNRPDTGLPLGQAVKANLFATYSGRPPLALWNQRGKMLDTMNVAMCEVAVDTETGEVEILRFGVVADTGKIMRRTSLESQIEQVMFFSEGCQLYEDYFYDKKTGVKLNTNMFEYKKPTMLDHAPVAMELLETRAGNAAYGSNGISHSLANTHLVIAAIYNATGKWVDPPATPDKVLNALGKV